MAIPKPHGGELKDLIARDASKKAELLSKFETLEHKINLSGRQICDLELILNGGFSPLTGFLSEDDYNSVVEKSRLTNGTLWTIPITLDVSNVDGLKVGEEVGLLQDNEIPIAILKIDSLWKPNKQRESLIFSKGDLEHPANKYLFEQAGDYYIGGEITGAISLPKHYDYLEFRKTPSQLRAEFESTEGWDKVVAFQTRNPMHRAHKELTERAAKNIGGKVLIHPVVGMTKPGDIDHHTRVKVYKEIINKYPEDTQAKLSLLPIAMRMGGDLEAVWHAIIRQNYGCSHFIIGRSHACPGSNSKGEEFYGPYDAQQLVASYKDELNIDILPFRMITYLPEEDRYVAIDEITEEEKAKTVNISGTQLRNKLKFGQDIPEWFSYPEVVKILRQRNPARYNQGFLISYDFDNKNLSKTQLTNGLLSKFLEQSSTRFFKVIDSEDFVNGIDTQIVNDFINANSGLIFNEVDNGNVKNIEKNHYVVGKDIEIEESDDVDSVLEKVLGLLKTENFFV